MSPPFQCVGSVERLSGVFHLLDRVTDGTQ